MWAAYWRWKNENEQNSVFELIISDKFQEIISIIPLFIHSLYSDSGDEDETN